MNTRSLLTSYTLTIITIALVFPLALTITEILLTLHPAYLIIIEKWFIFSAIGLRLSLAGISQLLRPEYTLKNIFNIDHPKSVVLVRELGIHNLLLGIPGLLIPLFPSLTIIVACLGGAFFLFAGILHIIKKPATQHEYIAMISDIFIAMITYGLLLCRYFLQNQPI